MDKRALKEFAVYARTELRQQIAMRAATFGVTAEGCASLHVGSDYVEVNNEKYDLKYKKSFEKLFHEVETKSYDNVLEEVAYTWFNRLIAIRYMEIHDYLPSRIRVLSSETKGKIDPDILTEYRHADFPEKIVVEVNALLESNDREGAYRKLLKAQCNELNDIMPFLFEKVTDYTELLLPESLLHADSLINKLARDMDDENFKHVEVIGWLYQYYISEKKDEVFEGLRKNKKIKKENIPAATQLFTPHWIVRYMVENSVGQMWLESHQESTIKRGMTYYVEHAEQEAEVQQKLDELRNPNLRPEDITVLDPACGSGHILVYAFDLLYQIYEERGYSTREIPTLILENNLYGIDIDDRAAQLASFALLMKAREKSKRIFRNPPKLNVIAIQESNDLPVEAIVEVIGQTEEQKLEIRALLKDFSDAKNYGSILQPASIDYDVLLKRIDELKNTTDQMDLDTFEVFERIEEIEQLFIQGKMLSTQYDVVITNPPYMGSRGMNTNLTKYLSDNHKDSKNDLFAVFMGRCSTFTKDNGYHAEINQHAWMFLSSYQELRTDILFNQTILSMIHLGAHAFEEIGGEVVQSTTFILRKTPLNSFKGKFYRLVNTDNHIQKEIDFISKKNEYICNGLSFNAIAGNIISYWASSKVLSLFEQVQSLQESVELKKGMMTGNNDKFLRLWYECNEKKVNFNVSSTNDLTKSKWFPCATGGQSRKWYGNNEMVLEWENDGEEMKNYRNSSGLLLSRPQPHSAIFSNKIVWNMISSVNFSVKHLSSGTFFSNAQLACLISEDEGYYLSGLMNTKIVRYLLQFLAPTINFSLDAVGKLPIIYHNLSERIIFLVKENIRLSKLDWDSFETSWDFECHPFLVYLNNSTKLESCFKNWASHAETHFRQLQKNEEELNRIFIGLYGLQEELTPEVPDEEITVRRADRERDAKSFLSYCVGLMMGRYSLDEEGLVFAGGEWDASKYKSFTPDDDGILPITEKVYFEDDVVTRLEMILVTLYGQDTLAENLRWLAESLTMKSTETPVERLRRYFFDEFYKDHCKIYSKRPIYWMVDSGKKKGFRALVYLHRYNTETLAKTRFQYVQELQEKLGAERRRIEHDLVNTDLTAAMKKRNEKQLTTVKAQQDELVVFDKKLAELANRRIALDLDNGVVANYAELQDVLAKI